jgi:hypothetical protein
MLLNENFRDFPLSIVTVSLKTGRLVSELPRITFQERLTCDSVIIVLGIMEYFQLDQNVKFFSFSYSSNPARTT